MDFGDLIEIQINPQADNNGFHRVNWIFSSGSKIEGGRIGKSKKYEGLWVQMPSFNIGGGKWVKPIKLSPAHEDLIREATIKEFEDLNQKESDEEEIDIDKIDF